MCKATIAGAAAELRRNSASVAKFELLRTAEAAAYLGLAERTLPSWRSLGRGPKYIKSGRVVRYRTTDLDEWLESRTVATSESRGAAESAS